MPKFLKVAILKIAQKSLEFAVKLAEDDVRRTGSETAHRDLRVTRYLLSDLKDIEVPTPLERISG